MLLHGFTHTGASWDRVLAALPERYRPLTPDIRGHGSASAVTPVTLEAVIGDIDRLAPGRFELAGYSMGGRLALQVALALPGRVRRLSLIGASPGIADAGEREARRSADELLADEVEASSLEAFARRWARTPVLAGLSEEVGAAVHADRLRGSTAGLAAALRGLGTGALPSVWERLDQLSMPVRLVVGERDQKFRAVASAMAARLPDAEVVVVAGAGHAVHLEAPQRVSEALSAGEVII